MLNRLADYSIDHPVFVIVLLLMALIAGGYSYTKIPVEAVPEIVIPIVLVHTPWAGVGPEEIEEEITKTLETAFTQLDNIDSIESYSVEGMSIVVVQFVAGMDVNKSIDDINEKVNEAQRDLPDDADDTFVQDINFGDLPILQLGLASNLPPREFRRVAEDFADELEAIDGINNVLMIGEVAEEVRISVDPHRMSALGVTFSDITRTLNAENLNVPTGNLTLGDSRWLVRATGEFDDLEEIRNLPLRAGESGVLKLRDIAEITLDPEDRESYSRLDGRESIGLYIQKKTGTNTIQLAGRVFETMERWEPAFEAMDVDVVIVNNLAEFITNRFKMMNLSARYGILLVVLVVWFFIGFRNSIIVAMAIPFTLTLAFGLMHIAGITLSDTSTFAIILVLGMLVDEDIVVVENTYRHLQYGESRLEAARNGIHEVGTPIFSAVLTTMAAFMPLLIMSGVMGEFMKFIPMTVMLCLVCAFVLAHTVLPVLTSMLLRVKKTDLVNNDNSDADNVNSNSSGQINEHYLFLPWLLRPYERTLKWSLGITKVGSKKVQNHVFIGIICWSLLLLALIGISKLDQQLFPSVSMARFDITLKTPKGTDVEETNRLAYIVEDILDEVPEIKHKLVAVGRSGGNDKFSFITSDNPTVAEFSIELHEDDNEKNNDLVERIINELRAATSGIAGADIEFGQQEMGPPVGAPVVVRIMGDDLDILHELALDVEAELNAINDEFEAEDEIRPIVEISNDFPELVPEVRINIDRERAARFGLTTAQVAVELRSALSGTDTTEYTIEELDRTVDIVVRTPKSARLSFDSLHTYKFRSPVTGALVPFSSIGEFEIGEGYSILQRRDQSRIVNVRTDLEGASPHEITLRLEEKLQVLSMEFPAGYTYEIGGEQEMLDESFSDLSIALVIALLLIYVILVWQFNSPLQPLSIMTSIPFAIIGIVLGLYVTDQPFGMLPFMALVALSGIVVNDSIVLITYINQLRNSGLDKKKAIIRACITRLRPIIMTSVTTSLGILPLTLGWGAPPNEAGAWFPFGVSMIFGLMTATLLILLVIPTVYWAVTNWEEAIAAKFNGKA